MRRLLIAALLLLLLPGGPAYAQNQPLSALPAETSPQATDIFYLVRPGGSPPDRKIEYQNIRPPVTAPPQIEIRRYPAAGCDGTTGTVLAAPVWDLKITTPAVAACGGSNVLKGVLNFPDTTGGFAAEMHDILPASWTTTGGVDFSLYWSSTATSGNGRWVVQLVCTPVNGTAADDPVYPTSGNGFNPITTAVPGTAGFVQTSAIVGVTLPASCVSQTPLLIHIRLFTDGQNASDSQTGIKSAIFAELKYRVI